MIQIPAAARRFTAVSVLIMVLGACAQIPKSQMPTSAAAPTPTAGGPVATPGLEPRERARKAMDLLGLGQSAQARVEIVQLLSDQPGSATGRKLLDQIDKDPKVLLGARNYSYKVRPGETMSELADRFLGDPILFYGLARYNNIDAPAQMSAGQILKIPGVPKAPAASKPTVKPADEVPSSAAGRNPARAGQLRDMALEDMNRGAIDSALARLRLAVQLDPDNGLIRRDLDRALRIHAAVQGP